MFAILGLYFYSGIRLQALFYSAIILHYYIIILHYSIMLQALHMREGLPVLTRVCSKLTSRTTSPALWSIAEEVPLVCHISSAQWPLSPVFPGLTYSHSFIHSCTFFKKIFIWLHRVLVATRGISNLHCDPCRSFFFFSCSMWSLQSWNANC